MADKPLPWFRAYHESAFDPKFDIAASQTGLHHLIVFGAWWKLLCLAGASPIRGTLNVTAMKRFSNDDVAAMLRLSNEDCNKLLEAFIGLDMLDVDKKTKTISIRNWDKRQFGSDSSTNRVKKYREKHKDVTPKKRFSNVSETPPDTDTDTDSDVEAEKTNAAGKPATEFQKSQQEYIDKFCELTGIPQPDHKSKAFRTPWGGSSATVVKALNGHALECLPIAVNRLRKQGMTIATPKSVEKTIMAVYGEQQHVAPDHDAIMAEFLKGTMSPEEAEIAGLKAHGRL
jgi:hypothetical protein